MRKWAVISARALTGFLLALLVLAGSPTLADDVLRLPIGDPARRDKTVALLLDGIVDTGDGAVLTAEQVAERLRDVRILFVGENHTAVEFHRAQQMIIEALMRSGRPVLVGLEMFPVSQQVELDRWIGDKPAEQDFVKTSRWYEHWSYNWEYYREIFLSAQRADVPMFALNAPREVVSAVRRKGIANLAPEEAQYLPPSIDTDNPEHLRLFKSYFGDDDALHSSMSEQQWLSMFAAQCTWDATMGYNAVRALLAHGDDSAIMVVLIGSGHVSYGLGIERQARRFFDGAMASLIPVPVNDVDGTSIDTVSGAYANFVWGVPAEVSPPFPRLGLSTVLGDDGWGLTVINAQDDAPGARAGLQAGDHLLMLDGHALIDNETINRLMAQERWGGSVVIEYTRAEIQRTVEVPLRRSQR